MKSLFVLVLTASMVGGGVVLPGVHDAEKVRAYNAARTALAGGALRQARQILAAVPPTDAQPMRALLLFLHAQLAYQEGRLAGLRAQGPAARPTDWKTALSRTSFAAQAWREAALSRPEWPEALRNAERAMRLHATLRELAPEADSAAAPPPSNPPSTQIPDPRRPSPTPQQIADWKQRIEKEMERQRRERLATPPLDRVEVEKDW